MLNDSRHKHNVRIFYRATDVIGGPSDCEWMVPGTFDPNEEPTFENWHGTILSEPNAPISAASWVEGDVK